jgi:hypothetical protein
MLTVRAGSVRPDVERYRIASPYLVPTRIFVHGVVFKT